MDPIPFRGFDERNELRIYNHGLLPHWRQNNCTYFVTYRLADSIPQKVVREFKYERNLWLLHRGIDVEKMEREQRDWRAELIKLTQSDQRVYQRTMANRLNNYLDAGYGSCILRHSKIRKIVSDSLEFFHNDRILTGDFVAMPNHVHALLRPIHGHQLEDVVGTIKSFSTKQINRLCGRSGQLWMRESYDHIVRNLEELDAFQQYIRSNPARASLRVDEYTLRTAVYVPDAP